MSAGNNGDDKDREIARLREEVLSKYREITSLQCDKATLEQEIFERIAWTIATNGKMQSLSNELEVCRYEAADEARENSLLRQQKQDLAEELAEAKVCLATANLRHDELARQHAEAMWNL